MIAGVLAGLAEYFLVDPTIFRLAYVVLVLITGVFPGILAYIIAYFIIPERPQQSQAAPVKDEPSSAKASAGEVETTIIPSKDLFRVAHEEMQDRAEKIIPTSEDLHVQPILPGELKKPQWPTLTDIKNKESEDVTPPVDDEPDTASFEDLFDDDSLVGLDDVIDE